MVSYFITSIYQSKQVHITFNYEPAYYPCSQLICRGHFEYRPHHDLAYVHDARRACHRRGACQRQQHAYSCLQQLSQFPRQDHDDHEYQNNRQRVRRHELLSLELSVTIVMYQLIET